MIKIFHLVLDLLEIPASPEHLFLAQQIIDSPDKKIISFYAQGFVFLAFQQLLLGKISQEDFIAVGDSYGVLQQQQVSSLYGAKDSLLYGITNDSKTYANCFIIFPKSEKPNFGDDIDFVIDSLNKLGSQIVFL